MKNNHKCFSLVEMIISTAILGIVAVASLGFLASGSRGFSSVSGNVNLQYKSQLAMNNIQERIIDCNAGIYFNDATDTLYLLDSETVPNAETGEDEAVYTTHIFRYDGTKNAVYYGECQASMEYTGEYLFTDSAPDLLTDGVSGFHVDMNGDAGISEATVTMTFFIRNKSFTGTQAIALRNRPPLATVTALSAP